MRRSLLHAAGLTMLLLAGPLAAATGATTDWPRWLGPSQDGRATAPAGLAGQPLALELAWKRPLGIGYTGIAVAGDRAVTMFADGTRDWVVAVDTKTGKELWRHEIGPMFPSRGGSEGGPAGMPVIADGTVYALGAQGHLLALSLADGKELWSLRIDEQLGARAPGFGFSTVPLVAGPILFVQAGGDANRSLVGFDRATGKVLWSTGDDAVGYQSPILAYLGGREQVVAVTNRAVLGLVPATGAVLWSHAHELGNDDGAATPVLLGGDRFLLAGENEAKAYQLEQDGAAWPLRQLWATTALKRSLAVPVLHEGHLYGFDDEFLTCVDAATGQKVWKSRPPGGRGLIGLDGRLLVFANDGAMVVVEATPEGYREQSRLAVAEAGTYTYPSFANGLIFVRNTRDFAGIAVRPGPKAAGAGAARAAADPRNAFERFVRRVEQAPDKRLLIDDYMAAQERFPIVDDDRWVHFVYRGEAEDVAITGSMTEMQVEQPLAKIEGTDLYYGSFPIEPGMRWEYRYNVGFENLQPDPLNPRRVPGREGDMSEIATRGFTRPAWLRPFEGVERGRIERFELTSAILGNARPIDVYLPAGYGGTSRHPLLVVNDGPGWIDLGHLPNVLDQLTGRGLAPIIVAFVHPPTGPDGRGELGSPKADEHVRMLAEELVPQLESRYRTLARPDARAMLGVGTAGAMAAYAAALRPDVFGKAAVCSVHLNAPAGERLVKLLESFPVGASKPEFRVGWNRSDLRREEWRFDLARDSKRLGELLDAQGFRVSAAEARDSAGWGGWPIRAGEMLQALFPM